ncbi:MAG TPA: MBL fold metallo-hydrolase [Mucilaginibacter sp.]|jgi:ribonuclease BN (tRNA processing enzyme)|nr:MBL fold metallo-hydrolase [Mucilaginibacter sp.]
MYKLFLLLVMVIATHSASGRPQKTSKPTQVILLGTGTPTADPERSGPSLAIVVNNTSYVVDCGPGVVRRAGAAAAKYNIPSLRPAGLKHLFITHLHSDHTIGYPDFILTPAVLRRNGPLEVYGPKGLQDMTNYLLKAYQEDINIRLNGLEHGKPGGYKVNVHEITQGVIYRDSNIVVTAFNVHHGSWPQAFGYRFETKDKIIVVSGDCTYDENLIKHAMNCDILIHEVYSAAGFSKLLPAEQAYHSVFHTSSAQLATIANKVHPKLLVLTHQLLFGSTKDELLHEITSLYSGEVKYGNDLDAF